MKSFCGRDRFSRLLKILCKPPKWYRIKISFWRLKDAKVQRQPGSKSSKKGKKRKVRHKRIEPTRPKSFIFRILGHFSPCNTGSIDASKKHPIMRKLKLFGCFAVLKCHIFVGTRKKTKQCFRLARLFDAVTAKRGCFKTVLVRLSYA